VVNIILLGLNYMLKFVDCVVSQYVILWIHLKKTFKVLTSLISGIKANDCMRYGGVVQT
jgi:hypothetical protein